MIVSPDQRAGQLDEAQLSEHNKILLGPGKKNILKLHGMISQKYHKAASFI